MGSNGMELEPQKPAHYPPRSAPIYRDFIGTAGIFKTFWYFSSVVIILLTREGKEKCAHMNSS
jgi:hypothetical protein